MQKNNDTVVFTNGCFDIIHRGHLEILKFCKSLGKVIVGLNSDDSVRRLKGPSRPINDQHDRAFHLLSLKYVDEVFVFHEDDPYNLIKRIKPDYIVKGSDYSADSVIGKDLAKVIIFDQLNGYSTTKTIKDIIDR